jgi:glycosyltransferase involved in cell wall biosynthesis
LLHGRRVVVVMPAYNAARTLRKTHSEIPHDVVDEVLLTDDASGDETVRVARELGITTFVHAHNRGYGANQKTCYAAALSRGADIAVMLHPDYQYTPRLITAMAALIACDVYDVVLGSRILVGSAMRGGMPLYKYVANRALTLVENLLVGSKLSEFHTGYRAFSRRVLETLPLLEGSDDFVFDNQMLLQALYLGFRVGEISCPAKYEEDSSSIGFRRSVVYGFGVLGTALRFRLARWGLARPGIFDPAGRRLEVPVATAAGEVAAAAVAGSSSRR